MDESGKTKTRFFSQAAPESGRSVRHSRTDVRGQRPGPPEWSGMTGAQLRLSAWSELPDRHRNEVCRQIRMRCEAFINSVRIERSLRGGETDRLVSEVVAHLLRATSLPKEGRKEGLRMDGESPAEQSDVVVASGPANSAPAGALPWLISGRLDQYEPMRDARVIWVVEETCNRQALFHRYEDVRRRDRGGKWDGSGYPLVAVDEQTLEQLSGHYDPAEEETDALQAEDSRRAWDGLVHLAVHHFGGKDDIVALVQVLANDRDTQESFGSQWPISKIVRALNAKEAQAVWNDDRVENAKRRLAKFIIRFKEEHGLDAVDLRALLARYARQRHAAIGRVPRAK
jgi:hypothetical protein